MGASAFLTPSDESGSSHHRLGAPAPACRGRLRHHVLSSPRWDSRDSLGCRRLAEPGGGRSRGPAFSDDPQWGGPGGRQSGVIQPSLSTGAAQLLGPGPPQPRAEAPPPALRPSTSGFPVASSSSPLLTGAPGLRRQYLPLCGGKAPSVPLGPRLGVWGSEDQALLSPPPEPHGELEARSRCGRGRVPVAPALDPASLLHDIG